MKHLDRHLYALTYAVGTYISYLAGPMPPLDFPLRAIGWLMAGTYALSYASTYLSLGQTFLRKVGQAASIYVISFYAFWVVGNFVLKLSSAPPVRALMGMTITFLIGSPIVLYKLLIAASVGISLQYMFKFLGKKFT